MHQDTTVTYDNRLQAATYVLDNPSDSDAATFSKTYDYYADGKLKLADETVSTAANKYDRSFAYDHMGRVKDAKSGSEAKGTEETDYTKLPYQQTYSYNAFNNMTLRLSTLWNVTGDWGFGYTFANNRAAGSTYDNDGRQTGGGEDINFLYDGAGRMSKTWRDLRYETLLYQDGLGNEGKRSQRIWTVPDDPSSSWGAWQTRYFIFSSVLGRNVTEASSTGKKRRTYVIAGGTTVARQGIDEGTTTERVGWEHHDAAGLSARPTFPSGDSGGGEVAVSEELDGLGNNVGIAAPLQHHIPNKISSGDSLSFTDTDSGDIEVDGILMPGSMVQGMGEALGITVPFTAADGSTLSVHYAFDHSRELPGRIAGASVPSQIQASWTVRGGEVVNRSFSELGKTTFWFGGQQQTQHSPSAPVDPIDDKPICPPSIDSILDKSWFASDSESQAFVDKLIGYANGMAKRDNGVRTIKPDRYIEQGGWILMNAAGTRLHYQVKPTEQQDTGIGVYLNDQELNKYVGDYLKRGWRVVADFHTHVDRGNTVHQGDIDIATVRQHPGFVIDIDGKTFAYGPKSGFRDIGVPKGCK